MKLCTLESNRHQRQRSVGSQQWALTVCSLSGHGDSDDGETAEAPEQQVWLQSINHLSNRASQAPGAPSPNRFAKINAVAWIIFLFSVLGFPKTLYRTDTEHSSSDNSLFPMTPQKPAFGGALKCHQETPDTGPLQPRVIRSSQRKETVFWKEIYNRHRPSGH